MRLGGPPTRTRWGGHTWPDQVAPRGRKASSTRKIKPQTSNHSWRVLVWALRLHPATPGLGARRESVCLGSGFGCTPPLLACAGLGAPLAPCHSWLGCAPSMCVFALGLRLHPATPGWGVGVCVCCWAWLSSVVSWMILVAPGVVSRWRAVVCPWVLCCAVLLRVVPPGLALLCAVLFRFAPFGASARCVVSWGAVRRLGVMCLLAPCFVLSPRAVCVLLWCVAAWCCSLLCFVPCAPWGVVLCVSCRLRPVRFCCVVRSPPVPCSPVLCPVVLCCRVVPWCPVLPPCLVCFLRGCGCTYLKNRCKISLNIFFFFFFCLLKIRKIIHDPTHSPAARPCTLQCLTCYPSFLMFLSLYLCVASWSVLVSIAKG